MKSCHALCALALLLAGVAIAGKPPEEEVVPLAQAPRLLLERRTAPGGRAECYLFVDSGPHYLVFEGERRLTFRPQDEAERFSAQASHSLQLGGSEPLPLSLVDDGGLALVGPGVLEAATALSRHVPLLLRSTPAGQDARDSGFVHAAFYAAWVVAERECGWRSLDVGSGGLSWRPEEVGLQVSVVPAVERLAAHAITVKEDRIDGSRTAELDIPVGQGLSLQLFVDLRSKRAAPHGWLLSMSDEWEYLECHSLTLLIDGRRLPVRTTHDGRVSRGVLEFIEFDLPRAELARWAKAKSIEGKLCNTEFTLSDEVRGVIAEYARASGIVPRAAATKKPAAARQQRASAE